MAIIVGIFGLFIGSFLNVLIDRLPKGQNVLWGRSHCDWCKRTLRWYELIPVASFLVQRGRCLRCHRVLSWQYPMIEVATAIGFFFIYNSFSGSPWVFFSSLVLFSSFLVITIADFKYQIIPDSMIATGVVAAVSYLLARYVGSTIFWHLVTAICVAVFFYFLWLITKRRGIGFGDVKLSFLLGLFLGFPQTIMALYVAFLTGAGVGVILILGGKRTLKSKIAFGPFLIIGMAIVVIFDSNILKLWHMIF